MKSFPEMNKTKQIAKIFKKNSDLVEIYCTILNKIPGFINVYLFFPGFIIHNSNIIVHKKFNRAGHVPKLLLYTVVDTRLL